MTRIGRCFACAHVGEIGASPNARCTDDRRCDRNRMLNRWSASRKLVRLAVVHGTRRLFVLRDPGEPAGIALVESVADSSLFEEHEIAGIASRLEGGRR